ncbi:DUF5313 family protein [Rhodococcus sp. G-MC3]|uniref:DUF5313 family protein n=1 Tax=Rhodococcus sp. G-MC3 TaxID=3046209 RepID=UPI0024BB8117|nr:DUF5313 family protein [Rhodococcus sp. G-MC3]MDJ0395818.1 DUF5313 family protein [Rhodococcus sp. G-MC3]
MTIEPRPGIRQIAAYIAGRPLPEEFNAWVIHDITGAGSTRRYATRCIVPLTPLLAACLLVPGPLVVRAGMLLILLLPFVYFMLALTPIYQRHRLVSHGLDPALLSAYRQQKIDDDSARYSARYRSSG